MFCHDVRAQRRDSVVSTPATNLSQWSKVMLYHRHLLSVRGCLFQESHPGLHYLTSLTKRPGCNCARHNVRVQAKYTVHVQRSVRRYKCHGGITQSLTWRQIGVYCHPRCENNPAGVLLLPEVHLSVATSSTGTNRESCPMTKVILERDPSFSAPLRSRGRKEGVKLPRRATAVC